MAKILYFITQSEYGGAQRYVFDLADNLKKDFEVRCPKCMPALSISSTVGIFIVVFPLVLYS